MRRMFVSSTLIVYSWSTFGDWHGIGIYARYIGMTPLEASLI